MLLNYFCLKRKVERLTCRISPNYDSENVLLFEFRNGLIRYTFHSEETSTARKSTLRT